MQNKFKNGPSNPTTLNKHISENELVMQVKRLRFSELIKKYYDLIT